VNRGPIEPVTIDRLRVVWIVLISACIVYGALTWLLGPVYAVDPELLRWLVIFGAVFAGILLLTVFLLKQLIAGVTGSNYSSYAIVRWSLMELIGVMGLILRVLGGELMTSGAFILLGVVMILTMPPSLNEAEELDRMMR